MSARWLAALLVLAGRTYAQIFGCGDDGVLPASADGRQNPAGQQPGYVEWWFFTAFSKSSDVGAAFTYHPSSKAVDFMLYLNATKPTATIINFAQAFDNATSTVANASITILSHGVGCEVIVHDRRTYEVRGGARSQSGNASLKWNLRYAQAVDAAREHADALGIVELDWLSYMPTASVSGEMVYDDGLGHVVTLPMDHAVGYHDHNSGRWPKLRSQAASAAAAAAPAMQAEEPQLKLNFDYKWGSVGDASAIGAVYGAYLIPDPLLPLKPLMSFDYIFVRAHGKRIKFGTLCRHHKLTVRPTGFVHRPGGHKEATGVHLTADTPDWSLDWQHSVLSSAANPGGAGLGLIVYEQLSTHNLTLTPKTSSAARWLKGPAADATPPFATLRGAYGFTEWSNGR